MAERSVCSTGQDAGILIEGERLADGTFAVVIGIGVNCAQHPADVGYPATDLPPAALRLRAARSVCALSDAMLLRLAQWARGAALHAFARDWLARAAGLGGRSACACRIASIVRRIRGHRSTAAVCYCACRRTDRDRHGRRCHSAGEVVIGVQGLRSTSQRRQPVMPASDELVFAPLGGVGEIGMNLALYGLGDAAPQDMDRGRFRLSLRGRGICRASISSCPTSAS